MRVRITKKGGFAGKDNNSPRCISYVEGQVVDGDIAKTVLENGWGVDLSAEAEKAPAAAPSKAPPRRAPSDKAASLPERK